MSSLTRWVLAYKKTVVVGWVLLTIAGIAAAGPGKDIVRARRGSRDRIDCGPGKDKAIIDKRRDQTRHCEKVKKK